MNFKVVAALAHSRKKTTAQLIWSFLASDWNSTADHLKSRSVSFAKFGFLLSFHFQPLFTNLHISKTIVKRLRTWQTKRIFNKLLII